MQGRVRAYGAGAGLQEKIDIIVIVIIATEADDRGASANEVVPDGRVVGWLDQLKCWVNIASWALKHNSQRGTIPHSV